MKRAEVETTSSKSV